MSFVVGEDDDVVKSLFEDTTTRPRSKLPFADILVNHGKLRPAAAAGIHCGLDWRHLFDAFVEGIMNLM